MHTDIDIQALMELVRQAGKLLYDRGAPPTSARRAGRTTSPRWTWQSKAFSGKNFPSGGPISSS